MKLGLIAMSATRAHNPELTKLGFTLPGFVDRSRVIASLPSLGLLTLAGLTPTHIDMEYLDVPDLAKLDDLPGEFDAVAISSFTAQMKEAYELADRYRAAGTTVLLGGLHATALPEEALAHADEGTVAKPFGEHVLDFALGEPCIDGGGVTGGDDAPLHRCEVRGEHDSGHHTARLRDRLLHLGPVPMLAHLVGAHPFVHGTEAPGEALRRQAEDSAIKELLERARSRPDPPAPASPRCDLRRGG